jgi:hypothetical protein
LEVNVVFPANPYLDLALGVLLLLILVLLFWRLRSEQSFNLRPPAPPSSSQPGETSSPRYNDLVPGEISRGGFSSQLQTPSYNLRIESLDNQMRFVVNGVTYYSMDSIPEPEMRRTAQKLMDKSFRKYPRRQMQKGTIRQVMMGNQTTIEDRNPDYNISVQIDGKQKRYLVNGLTYYSLNEIPDPYMRRRAKQLMKMMV